MSFKHEADKIKKRIIENTELDRAEVLLAAGSMSDKLQRMIKTLGEIRNEDLVTVVSSARQEMGVEAADEFANDVSGQIEIALTTLRGALDSVEKSVLRLSGESIPSSSIVSDLDTDVIDIAGDEELDDMEDLVVDDEEEITDEFPLGRGMKESVVTEFEVTYKSGLQESFVVDAEPSVAKKQIVEYVSEFNKENSGNPIKFVSLKESAGKKF